MRRSIAVILLLTLLCACGGKEKNTPEEAIAFRAALVEAGGCTFRGEITADFGDSVTTFTVDCAAGADGTVQLTLVQPEELSGIAATVTDDGGTVTYDGLILEFGLLAEGNLIPAAAPAVVVACWRGEYISCAGTEDEYYRVTYEKGYDEKCLIVDTFFQNGLPIYAEICYNNRTVLKLAVSEFTLNERK